MKTKLSNTVVLFLILIGTACSSVTPTLDAPTPLNVIKSKSTATLEQATITPLPPSTSPPTPTQTTTPALPGPTAVSSASPTATHVLMLEPTNTVAAESSVQGPRLLIDASAYGGDVSLWMISADGSDQQQVPLPKGAMIFQLESAVSPDGQWLAFYTGSITSPYDLALKLFNFADQTILTVTRLLSPEYPANLFTIAETLALNDVEYPNPQDWMFSVNEAFELSIYNLSWSPDGSYLAFTGSMQGPSTDLYLFEIENQSIHKVTEEPQFISGAQWSPDGQWITVCTTIPGAMYITRRIHMVRSRDRRVRWLRRIYPNTSWPTSAWQSKDFLFMLGQGDGGDPYSLIFLDIQKDQAVEAWPGTVYAYAVDIEKRIIALSGVPYWSKPTDEIEIPAGFYFVSIDNVQEVLKISDDVFWQLVFWGGARWKFIGNDGRNIVGIAEDSSITPFYKSKTSYSRMLISPDHRWLTIFGQGEGLNLFSEKGDLVYASRLQTGHILWRPDSAGLFISSDKLYYLPLLPDGSFGEMAFVKQCNKFCVFLSNAAWLP